jgi:8-oxo-dGTP diphosphatase
VRITILRHASAGHKGMSGGPDERRRLDATGERHADGLVSILASGEPRRIVCSPATRCIQTVGPLAHAVDLEIELWDGLGPAADPSDLVGCLADPSFDHAVLCTHGEVMGSLLELDVFRHVLAGGELSRRALLTKGTGWRLRVTAEGEVTSLKHVVPAIG